MKPAPDRRLSSLKLKHGLWVKILSSLPTRGSSRLPAFFLLRHRAARASAACAQILPPQGRRSIWREHGVVRVLCTVVHKNALPGKIVLLLHKMSGCTMCGDGGYVGRPRAAHTTYN